MSRDAERLRGPDPLGRLGVDDADLGQLVPQAEVVVADPDALVGLLVQLAGRLHQLRQLRELGPVDAQVLAVAEDHPVHALGQRLQHVRERDVGAVDDDLHLEVEPVGAGLVLVGARGC